MFDGVSRQADAQPHADADHRPRQPRVSRQAERPDRGLCQRVRFAGKGAGDLWQGGGGEMPVRDKKALADELRYAVNDANVYCLEHGIALAEIENMPTANFAQAGAIHNRSRPLDGAGDDQARFPCAGSIGQQLVSRGEARPGSSRVCATMRVPGCNCCMHPHRKRAAGYFAHHAGYPEPAG